LPSFCLYLYLCSSWSFPLLRYRIHNVDYEFNRCRTPDNVLKNSDWTVYTDEIFLCGERSCPMVNSVQLECLNPTDYYITPNEEELVNIKLGNGLLKYSNIFYALLSTFKQIFITGSSRLIVIFKQVLNPIFVILYYLSLIYLV